MEQAHYFSCVNRRGLAKAATTFSSSGGEVCNLMFLRVLTTALFFCEDLKGKRLASERGK